MAVLGTWLMHWGHASNTVCKNMGTWQHTALGKTASPNSLNPNLASRDHNDVLWVQSSPHHHLWPKFHANHRFN